MKPPPSFTRTRAGWPEWVWLAAGSAVLVLGLLAPGLRPGGIVFGWDTVGEHFAWESWVWDRYASGRGALWCSHVGCGFPFPAQGTTGVFYPLAFPHLFLSHGQACDLVLALHLWLLAAGCAVFVRSVGGGLAGALVSSAAVLASGPIVGSVVLGGRAQTFGLAWVPWMLVATERAVARGDARWFVLGGGVVGLSLLAGQPFATAQGIAASLGYVLLRRGPAGETRLGARWKVRVAWLAMLGVAVLIAAPQLASWLEYRPLAGGQGQLPPLLEALGALPPRQLVALLFPGFFGDEATTPYWGHFLFSVVNPYLGWSVLVLAPVGLGGSFRRVALPLAVIAVGTLVLAMGGHVPVVHQLWNHVPGAAAFHFPARWLALFAISSSIGAGLGASRLAGAGAGDVAWRRAARVSLVLLALAMVVALAATLGARDGVGRGWLRIFTAALQDPLRASVTQEAPVEAWVASAYAASRAALVRGVAVAAMAVAIVRALRSGAPRARAVALLVVVATDGGAWARRFVSHVDPRSFELSERVAARIRSVEPPSRYATTLAPSDTPGPRGLVRHFAGLDQYAQMPMHAGMLDGLDALQWGSYGLESVIRVVNGGTIFAQGFPTDRRWLDFLGVRWLVAPAGVRSPADLDGLRVSPVSRGFEELRLVENGDGYTLLENPHALPRARLVRDLLVAADEAERTARLADPVFDPAAQVVVLASEISGRSDQTAARVTRESSVAWTERDDGYMALRVRSVAPSLLVVAESHYPGWRAWVDGVQRTVVAVDGAFLGVEVPAGDSEVVFGYRPAWLWPSLLASALGFVLAGAAACALAGPIRRCGARTPESPRLAVAESP